MNVPFRIEQRESFRVIGYCLHTTNKRKKGRKEMAPAKPNYTCRLSLLAAITS